MSISDRIVEIRKNERMNQTEFAERLKLEQSLISRIERGNAALTERNIAHICLEFGLNEAWLKDGEGPMYKESSGKRPPDENELLRLYHDLSESLKKMVLEYVRLLYRDEEARKEQERAWEKGMNPPKKGERRTDTPEKPV